MTGLHRARPWMSPAILASLSIVVAATSACNALAASPSPPPGPAAVHDVANAVQADLLPGLVSRSTILTRYRSTRLGVATEAKLVSLADLDAASKGELTQCQFRKCPAGALVWLVLQKGSPGTFVSDLGVRASQSPAGAGAWSLAPVDATTGQARGDSEVGALGQLASSPWGQLRDVDASR